MKRLYIAFLIAGVLSAGQPPAKFSETVYGQNTATVASAKHSHKKFWIGLAVVVGSGILAGELAAASHHSPAVAATPDLKLISCAECHGTGR